MIFDGQSPALGGNGTCGGTLRNGEISSSNGGTGAASQSPEAPKPTAPCTDPNRSGRFFNGMIAPFLPMRLSAILWYQGEANDIGKKARCVGEAEYECLFPAMITGWRRRFDDMTLPFFYVLLAAGHTAELREAQYTGAGALRRTAFASAMDIGASAAEETIPGHPPRKQEVGRRLSLAMRAIMRGETDVDYKGPTVIASKTSFVSQSKTETSVMLTFDVGSNGFLHFNDTALCNKSSVPPNLTKTAATMAAPGSLVCCVSTGSRTPSPPYSFA